jgi:hypothetical protein
VDGEGLRKKRTDVWCVYPYKNGKGKGVTQRNKGTFKQGVSLDARPMCGGF